MSVWSPARSSSNSSRSSGPMTRSLAVSPWVRAFPEERALPSGVLGPVLRRALAALPVWRAADGDMFVFLFGFQLRGWRAARARFIPGSCSETEGFGSGCVVTGMLSSRNESGGQAAGHSAKWAGDCFPKAQVVSRGYSWFGARDLSKRLSSKRTEKLGLEPLQGC
jgi:hypothetical protein